MVTNHLGRGRLEIAALGTSPFTRIPVLLRAWRIPAGWTLKAEVRHTDGEQGLLIECNRTGILSMLTGRGAIRSLDQRKAQAGLREIGQ